MTTFIANHYAPEDLIWIGQRVWKITACCYGAVGQESVIGLIAYDRQLLPNNDEGKPLAAMYVPVHMLDALINTGLAKHYGLRAQEKGHP